VAAGSGLTAQTSRFPRHEVLIHRKACNIERRPRRL